MRPMPGLPPQTTPPQAAPPRVDAPRYQPLVVVLVAVCAGIVADRFRPLPVWVWWAGAACALVVWLALWRRWERAASIVLLVAVAATGASWHHCRWSLFDGDDLGDYAREQRQPACLEAIALKSPRLIPAAEPDPMEVIPHGDRARLELAVCSVRDGAGWRAASGRTRLDVDGPLDGVAAGDRLRIFCQVDAPQGVQNPGEFDYAAYLRARRVRSLLRTQYPECVSVVRRGQGWHPRRLIDRARRHGNRLLREHLDPGRSALAAAVLLGAREKVDPAQTRAFMETGTVHLLAISGLHLGILAGVLMFLVLRAPIPRGWAMLSVAVFVVFYMLLTDARPPVVRATILVLVMCGAVYLNRRAVSFNSLAAAGLVVLAINPSDLFHTGAQLSFLAVAGLMWFAPRWIYPSHDPDPLERMIAENRGWAAWIAWGLRKSVRRLTLIGGLIWLLTMPLVMARFHLFTLIAVPLNTLLWLPMTLALLSGFAAMVFGTLAAPLGALFGGLCDANIWLLQSSVDVARKVPLGHWWLPGPADWWLAVLYGGLGLAAAFPQIRPRCRWLVVLLAGWVVVGFAVAWLGPRPARLECTFLSVGHGCAVVVQLPSGGTVLYDAGQLGSGASAARSVAGMLWSRRITHLDAVVLSHADIDHYNALPELLDQFSVGVICVSPVMWEGRNPALRALQEAIRASGVPLRELGAGDRLPGGEGCMIEVLHPPRRGVSAADNANSIVLDVRYRGHRILLPGDLEPPGLDALLAEEPRDCDVLLVVASGVIRRAWPPGASPSGSSSAAVDAGTPARSRPPTVPPVARSFIRRRRGR